MKVVPGLKNQRQLNSGAPRGWQNASIKQFNTHGVKSESDSISLYATISTWNDADIIEANVKNCLANGCSRVFILDNASSDDTVDVALKAGAEIAEVYSTEFYDEDLRIRKQNGIIESVTKSDKKDILWWATLDADEFCCGRGGEPLAKTLTEMPECISTVGSDCIDLYPAFGCEYRYGDHPAACFTHGINRREGCGTYCPVGHYKHLYFKQTGGVFNIAQTRGNHCIATPGKSVLIEPVETLKFFHSPYRKRSDTFNRLHSLCSKSPELGGLHRSAGDDEVTGNHGAIKRWRGLEHVYRGEWDKVELPHSQLYGRSIIGIALYPWRVLAPELAGMFQ